MNLEEALLLHCVIISATLAVGAIALHRRGLLTILNAASWVLFASAIYFVFNPATSLLSGDLGRYQEVLRVFTREGEDRVYSTLFVLVAGLSVYLVTYAWGRRTPLPSAGTVSPVRFGRWSLPALTMIGLLLLAAGYSLLYFRARGLFIEEGPSVVFEGGRVVGGATGYSIIAHNFILFCIVLLLFRGPRIARWFGLSLAATFVVVRLYDAHDRASIVAVFAALAMVSLALSRSSAVDAAAAIRRFLASRLRVAVLLGMAGLMALFLVARGHSSIAQFEGIDLEESQQVLRRNDTAMLPVLYFESYLAENRGYDYGLPLASAALFGWIPRQAAPWKDTVQQFVFGLEERSLSTPEENWLRGAKSTVVGSFYRHGGPLSVVLGMFLLGLLTRGLDRLVAAGRTDLGRTLGMAWMANVWIMFGSSDLWILQNLFIHAIPFVGFWLAERLPGRAAPVFTGTVRAGGGRSHR